MPRVKPAVITLRDGTILRENKDKIEYGPQMIITYATEIQSVPVEQRERGLKRLLHWNKKTIVQEQKQVNVPIKSWPYAAIKEIDWGYMDKKAYDVIKAEMAKAKQAEEAKKAGKDVQPISKPKDVEST